MRHNSPYAGRMAGHDKPARVFSRADHRIMVRGFFIQKQ